MHARTAQLILDGKIIGPLVVVQKIRLGYAFAAKDCFEPIVGIGQLIYVAKQRKAFGPWNRSIGPRMLAWRSGGAGGGEIR